MRQPQENKWNQGATWDISKEQKKNDKNNNNNDNYNIYLFQTQWFQKYATWKQGTTFLDKFSFGSGII